MSFQYKQVDVKITYLFLVSKYLFDRAKKGPVKYCNVRVF